MTASWNTALTSPQLTQLRRRRWQGDQFISFCDNVYALAAQVNGAVNASTGTTAAFITFDNVTAGAYTNVDEGMVVIVSPTNDIRNKNAVRLHVRYLGCGATFVYVSEFSDPIADNSYIWILYAYDVIDNLSRPYGNPVVQLQQYDQSFQRMAPVILGLQTGYANWVDAAGHYDIAFNISTAYATESGATVSTYQFSVVPTGAGTASVIAGSAATATVTYRFTYGEYWLKAVVTDSNGIVSFRHVLIKAHDRTNYLPSLNFEGIEITRDVQSGQSARVKGYGGVSTLLNGSMCIIWVDEQYSDPDFSNSAGSIFGNIDLIGWIEAEENMYTIDPTYSAYAEVSFEVQGMASRLMRLEGQMLAITYSASPTLWDQINNLTVWRAIVHFLQRHTTALQLGDFACFSTDDTFLFPTIVTLAGRALDNVTGNQGIADEINGVVEFASDGRMELVRREPFVATDGGHTPIVVATWQGSDMINQFKWSFNHYSQYGYLDADGAAWPGVVNVPVMPCKNRAPGLAQGSGPDQAKLNNQILAATSDIVAAKAELAQRAGTQFAILNNVGVLTIDHPAQFHWLQPSFGQVYVWSLDATFNIRGLVLNSDTHWMLKSLTVRHDNKTGSRDVNASYIPVQTGTAGTDIPIITQGSTPPALPMLPPMPAFPAIELPLWPDGGLLPAQVTPTGTTTIATDGNSILTATTTKAYWFTDFIKLTTPHFNDVTPADLGSFTIRAVAISPFFTTSVVPAYILASDGTNSAVWRTTNVAAGTPTWIRGSLVSGIYTVLRCTDVSGSIMIYSTDTSAGSSTQTFDFTVNDGGWAANVDGGNQAVYIPGTGWSTTDNTDGTSTLRRIVAITRALPATALTGASETFNLTKGTYPSPAGATCLSIQAPVLTVLNSLGSNAAVSGNNQTFSWTGSTTASNIALIVVASNSTFDGAALITGASLTTTAPGGTVVRISTDDGSVWSAELSVNTVSPGSVGGFDVQRSGANSFAAANGKIYRATTLGGTYSAYYSITGGVDAVCIIIPYFNWAGTKQTTATNPDIVIALSGLDGSSRSLLWIEGGATPGTVHDITPVANSIFDNANAVTVSYNHHLALFCKVSGVYKLYRSTNQGGTWTLVGTRTAPKYIRGRRNDSAAAVSGTNKGQLFMADSSMYYSSVWDSVAPSIRNMPSTPIICFDTLY